MQITTKKTISEKNRNLCMLLLLVPVFFFSAYLYMGKRSQQSSYTKFGIFYGISSLVSFVVSALGFVWPTLLYGIILHAGVWILCVIQTISCRHQYSQHVQWAQECANQRSELVYQKAFRRRNAYWCIWDIIPFMGGFATYYIGAKLKKPIIKWLGGLSTLVVMGLYFYLTMFEQVTSGILTVLILVIAYCGTCMHPLLFGYYFEELLDVAAEQWTEDIQEYPQMENRFWRIKNSLWQVVTCLPYFGSWGLFWVAITRQSGKVLLKATILCILEAVCLAVPSAIMADAALLQAVPIMEGVAAGINALWIFIYALIVFTGAFIRQQMLCIRAIQEIRF